MHKLQIPCVYFNSSTPRFRNVKPAFAVNSPRITNFKLPFISERKLRRNNIAMKSFLTRKIDNTVKESRMNLERIILSRQNRRKKRLGRTDYYNKLMTKTFD